MPTSSPTLLAASWRRGAVTAEDDRAGDLSHNDSRRLIELPQRERVARGEGNLADLVDHAVADRFRNVADAARLTELFHLLLGSRRKEASFRAAVEDDFSRYRNDDVKGMHVVSHFCQSHLLRDRAAERDYWRQIELPLCCELGDDSGGGGPCRADRWSSLNSQCRLGESNEFRVER